MAHAPQDHIHGAGSGGGFFANFFEVFTPRQICMNQEPDVIWLHIVSDAMIAVAYFTIPLALVYFVRRRKDLVFNWMFQLFALFIVACGVTHVFGVWAIWQPVYRLDGAVKLFTGIVSLATAGLLWQLMPQALSLPSPAQLRLANAQLQEEISHRRIAEEKLRAANEQLETMYRQQRAELSTLLDLIPLSVWIAQDPECAQIHGNRACYELLDLPVGTNLSLRDDEMRYQAYRQDEPMSADEFPVNQAAATGQPVYGEELHIVLANGETVHLLGDAAPLRGPDGEVRGCIGAFVDITERRRVEEERKLLLESERAARNEAEQANRIKDEFLSTLSHELRTPLNAILGWSRILASGKIDDAERARGLEVIERNSKVQVQIIEELLDMSRIISGKIRLNVRALSVAEIIGAAIETVQHSADARQIQIHRILDPHAGPVMGDPDRLQQVFWNLLSNAIKFSPKGSRIQVFCQRVNSHIEVIIADNGAGIAPEFLPYVFDRFRQADAATNRTHGGLGLGLSIVKHLVELHGGTVHAVSPGLECGSTFTVCLPVLASLPQSPVSDHREASGVDAESSLPSLAGVKVLVVDDEADARYLIQKMLESGGAEVITAETVPAALEAFRTSRPDILVSDIGMPGDDGYDLIRGIRSLPVSEGGQTPAAALTAFARMEDRKRAMLAGFQAHVVKPVDATELVVVIATLLGKTGLS